MRPTTNSEKFLLGVLGLVLLGGLAFFGSKAFSQKQQTLNLTRDSLKADQAEAQVDLQKEPLWERRRAWIREHEPSFGEAGDMGAQVQNFVVQGARDHHLEVVEQNLNLGEVQHGPGGVRVNFEIKIKGSMEDLCRWLATLQKPESFYAVGLFSLKADEDQKSMACTLQVARYFRETTP